ncbi:MAG TPA: CehA/McbA family metallohydrolase [Gemmatimonadales bacterium]|nr:CehA/McbA family metallohydrolase [Gemmatimonadales bacterium]
MRPCAQIGLIALTSFAPLRLCAQRQPVLRQIQVPHNYYYREMYLPQVTSGPSSVAWSPDGTELVYSMQGSLWRQKIGSTEATQLTDGPGYDFQPDWSPDGRYLVYTSYRNDALELWLLNPTDGSTRALVANGAANLDPRWSPEGHHIAFVSTEFKGRWHVFLCVFAPSRPCAPERITSDTSTSAVRYYYSANDQYLSPTWSSDGTELILISNRGQVWGSGSFWRMHPHLGATMQEIRSEETNWKARPDWSREGTRVVYSSYLGRQRNQLWLTTAMGGDPFQLTYCECDHTAPRWSPDGRRIAFISNKDGNTSLQVVSVPGGAIETVRAVTRKRLHPSGTLTLTVEDAAGLKTPARISVTGADGRGWAPDTAWRYADDGFDRNQRKFEVTYFHATGTATLTLPAGEYTVEVLKGLEFSHLTRTVKVAANAARSERFRLTRLRDLPAEGWWSGDLHVHMNYGGVYRNDPSRLRRQAEAEDLHVVEDLIVNKEQRIPDVALFTGRPDPVSTSRTVIAHDEEYHTSWWGHTGHLGLTRNLILPNYAGYANTAAASLYPDNATIMDLTHAQGGLSGYVHPFDPPMPDPSGADALTSGLPVDVALGKVDYMEVMGFSDHRTTAEVWYRLLNTGFRIPAGAGTDAMANFASLRGPVGMNRVFVRSGPRLVYRAWLDALKAGRTFVSNGPLLGFTLSGRQIGDELTFPAGVHQVVARVSLRSIVPVERLEIVANGVVVSPVPLTAGGTRADAEIPLPVTRSGWFVVRAWSAGAVHPVLDLYPYATTSPIYVTVGGRAVRSAESARWFMQWIDRIAPAASAHPGWNDAAEKTEVLHRLAEARRVFQQRAGEATP